jgi:hypothetical protein
MLYASQDVKFISLHTLNQFYDHTQISLLDILFYSFEIKLVIDILFHWKFP